MYLCRSLVTLSTSPWPLPTPCCNVCQMPSLFPTTFCCSWNSSGCKQAWKLLWYLGDSPAVDEDLGVILHTVGQHSQRSSLELLLLLGVPLLGGHLVFVTHFRLLYFLIFCNSENKRLLFSYKQIHAWLGCAVVATGIAAAIFQTIRRQHRPPPRNNVELYGRRTECGM